MNLAPVIELLQQRTGLDPEALGRHAVRSAIVARMRVLQMTDIEDYSTVLGTDPGEYLRFIDEVIVSETWFLRGGDLFFYLAKHIRTVLAGRPPHPAESPHPPTPSPTQGRGGARLAPELFRVLSVPCSTGEEPYSLALALAETGVPAKRYSIDAIDVSPGNIQQACAGLFSELSFRQMPPELRKRYFQQRAGQQERAAGFIPAVCGEPPGLSRRSSAGMNPAARPGGVWEIDPALRSAVNFSTGNLLDPGLLLRERPYDLIFCRNLFIYLHAAARQQGMDTLLRLLAPAGLLCLGHAESLDPDDRRFERTGPAGFFLYRRTHEPVARPRPVRVSSAKRVEKRSLPARAPVVLETPVARPEPVTNLLSRARQQADGGQLLEALKSCQVVEERFGPSADLYSLMGVILQAKHELAEAMQNFRKALYLDPDHPEALMHLMLLAQMRGDRGQAELLRQRLRRIGSVPAEEDEQ